MTIRENIQVKNTNEYGFDLLDSHIIRLLQKDGRMPNIALAEALNISESTVRKRLRKILDSGVIQIVAVGNPIKMGFELAGVVKLNIEAKKADKILAELNEIDSIIWIALTTGSSDIDVEFIARSIQDLNSLIFGKIGKIDGVKSTETSIMVDVIKDKHDWGTGWN